MLTTSVICSCHICGSGGGIGKESQGKHSRHNYIIVNIITQLNYIALAIYFYYNHLRFKYT